jgi:hypothetical protein
MRKKLSCSETSTDKIWAQGIIGEKYQSTTETDIHKLTKRKRIGKGENYVNIFINIRINEAYHLLQRRKLKKHKELQ